MHSRTPVGLLRPDIIKDHSDAGEITRMSKKRVQIGNFSDYVPLLIEGFSYSFAPFLLDCSGLLPSTVM